jgi:hypothetical protein
VLLFPLASAHVFAVRSNSPMRYHAFAPVGNENGYSGIGGGKAGAAGGAGGGGGGSRSSLLYAYTSATFSRREGPGSKRVTYWPTTSPHIEVNGPNVAGAVLLAHRVPCTWAGDELPIQIS